MYIDIFDPHMTMYVTHVVMSHILICKSSTTLNETIHIINIYTYG